MTKALVTPDAVAAAAEQLLADGQDPTLILVQERVGGGSYSTVKRHLDAWKARREAPPPATPVPPALAEKGQALIMQIWSAALRVDDARVAQVQAAAQTQLQAVQQALREAEAVITQHEAAAEVNGQQIAELLAERTQLQQQHAALEHTALAATAQTEALRADLATLKAELAAAQAQLLDQARLEGELTALRRQLDDQAQLIARLTDRPDSAPTAPAKKR
jgi:septal ring factor EnvC (AmiA/AmiB activator)